MSIFDMEILLIAPYGVILVGCIFLGFGAGLARGQRSGTPKPETKSKKKPQTEVEFTRMLLELSIRELKAEQDNVKGLQIQILNEVGTLRSHITEGRSKG